MDQQCNAIIKHWTMSNVQMSTSDHNSCPHPFQDYYGKMQFIGKKQSQYAAERKQKLRKERLKYVNRRQSWAVDTKCETIPKRRNK